MREGQNPTIARLDRFAARLGLPLTHRGKTVREFTFDDGSRIINYRPGGKGVLKVQTLIWNGSDWVVDVEAHASEPRLKKIMTTAQEG